MRDRCKTGERQESEGEQERKKERVSADGHAVCDADDTKMADHKLSFLISNVQIPSCPSKVEKSETHCTNTHKERMPEHPFSLSCLSPAFIPLKKHWGVNCKCREPEDNYPQHTRLSISPLL